MVMISYHHIHNGGLGKKSLLTGPTFRYRSVCPLAAVDEFGYPQEVELLEKCPTRSSVLALSVTCALLALVYICTLFAVLTKRWMARGNKVV